VEKRGELSPAQKEMKRERGKERGKCPLLVFAPWSKKGG
jgi:hypothetical protein